MLMLLGQRCEESLICCWLVIQVTVLFFVTFYFCSQICDPRSLSLSLSLYIYVCVCVQFYSLLLFTFVHKYVIPVLCLCLSLSLSLSLYIYIYICVCVCVCVCVCKYAYKCMYLCLNSFYCGNAERILTNSSNVWNSLDKISSKHHWIYLTGTGKSQFLKFAAKLSNRSVITTGLGSTSAGLTVTAVKDGGNIHIASTLIR
jgi:hypothetical protein